MNIIQFTQYKTYTLLLNHKRKNVLKLKHFLKFEKLSIFILEKKLVEVCLLRNIDFNKIC